MSNTTADVIAERPSASGAPGDRGKVVNPIEGLQGFGQSVWLDYLRPSLFTSGEFSRLITEDGLRGVTSNPSIFEKAIAGSTDYLIVDVSQPPAAIVEQILTELREPARVDTGGSPDRRKAGA